MHKGSSGNPFRTVTWGTRSDYALMYFDSHSRRNMRDIKVVRTSTPVVNSHTVSDKSLVACSAVQMAPPICPFNTKGMWRMKCANSPLSPSRHSPHILFKRHFGVDPDVWDVFHQAAPSRHRAHKHDGDDWMIFIDALSLQSISIIGVNDRGSRSAISAHLSWWNTFLK